MLKIIFYFKEIKWLIFYLIISWLLSSFIIYNYIDSYWYLLIKIIKQDIKIIVTNVLEGLITQINISLSIGLLISFISFNIILLNYIKPSLYKKEWDILKKENKKIWLIFIISLFIYILILKYFIWFMIINLNKISNIEIMNKISELYNIIKNLYIYLQIIIIIPIFFNNNKIYNYYINNRILLYLFIYILIGLITPPDLLTTIIIMILVIIWLEISIWIKIFNKKW